MRVQFTPINVPVVATVALLSGLSMVLFFVHQNRHTVAEPVAEDTVVYEEPFDEIAYYSQVAGQYLSSLPMDKRVIATLIDSQNHNIVYYETTSHPSCYSYDLESLTTSVLFGGDNGFYAGTKLLILGTIQEWCRVGDNVFFIASNRAPAIEYPEETLVFSLDLSSRKLRFHRCVAEAHFVDGDAVSLVVANMMYHKLFSGDPVYSTAEVVEKLETML